MRIIVPFTEIHPLTERCLAEFAPQAERVNVGADAEAYWRLLRDLWSDGETFLIIEHDMEFTQAALDEALTCDCLWGLSPYPYFLSWRYESDGPHLNITPVGNALGFTRFRSDLMSACPTLLDDMPADSWVNGRQFRNGRHFYSLFGHLQHYLRLAQYLPHFHTPVVHHHIWDFPVLGATERICTCYGGDHLV
jgi:hypothetical protein